MYSVLTTNTVILFYNTSWAFAQFTILQFIICKNDKNKWYLNDVIHDIYNIIIL